MSGCVCAPSRVCFRTCLLFGSALLLISLSLTRDVDGTPQEDERRRKAEEEAMLKSRFVAKEVPLTTKQPLLQRMIEEREAAKRLNHEARVRVSECS